jgi:GNAT superfamily N-acetyltransferase
MSNGEPAIVIPTRPDQADRAAVLEALVAFNNTAAAPSIAQPVAILVQDSATGKTVGGLWGKISYDWLFVELFALPDQFRGQNTGSKILAGAETIARERGCVGVWLDTFEFQAPGFYKKQGYELFATIDDHPRGSHRFFFKKNLV